MPKRCVSLRPLHSRESRKLEQDWVGGARPTRRCDPSWNGPHPRCPTATRSIQAEMAAANTIVADWQDRGDASQSLSEDDVFAVLRSARGIVDLLAPEADRGDRLDLYRALGVSLSYERNTATGRELVHARSQLRGGGGRI